MMNTEEKTREEFSSIIQEANQEQLQLIGRLLKIVIVMGKIPNADGEEAYNNLFKKVKDDTITKEEYLSYMDTLEQIYHLQ